MSQAILLVNLGSPASPAASDVRPYLDEFLMDPYVIDVPTPLRALIVKGLILPTRPAATARAYAQVWTDGGSPLLVISERQRAALEAATGLPVGLAMRYGQPSIAAGLDALLQRTGPLGEVLVVPLYPHYAMASSTTVERAVERACGARNVACRIVGPFFGDPAYLDALAATVRRAVPEDAQFVLFSYHGLPKRHLRKTDPTGAHCLRSTDCCSTPSVAHARCYRHQVIAATDAVAARLGLGRDAYGFSFQSRLGSGWLEPFSDRELTALPGRGITRLAVVCPSFVADCLETLEEMAIRGRASFLAAGGSAFIYVPCLNDDPGWIAALAGIIAHATPVPA